MDKRVQFRIAELIARKKRKSGENVTYAIITEVTGISSNTLSNLNQGKSKMVAFSTIERLLDYFDCEVSDLIVYE